MVARATAALALGLGVALAGRPAWASGAGAPACQASRVKDIWPGAQGAFDPSNEPAPTAVGRSIFFPANDGQHGAELWKSDGTASGTVLLKDIREGPGGSNPRMLIAVGARVFFVADDGLHGPELWTSDGTSSGTALVQDVRPGPEGSQPSFLTPMGGALFFIADDGVHGQQIWRTDGSEAGTRMVRDLSTEPPGTAVRVYWLAATSTVLYMSVERGGLQEIWKSDGTAAGTQRVAAPYPPNPFGSIFLGPLVPVGDTLFFTGELAPADMRDLWKSNGTEAGTTKVSHIPFRLFEAVPLGDRLVWIADDERSLWTSDGTAAGTRQVAPLPEQGGMLTPVGETVFFVGSDPVNGTELFASDGSTVRLVRDIHPGTAGSEPQALLGSGGRLLFTAVDASGKRKIWVSDGTMGGTHPIATAGSASIRSSWLVEAGARLFFTAESPGTGLELWATTGSCAPLALQCPAPVTAEATSPDGAIVTYPPASFASGASSSEVQYDHPSGASFALGTTTVTATDDGEGARCTFTVTVQDTTPPALTCPPPQVAQASAGGSGTVVDYPDPTAIDAVSVPTITANPPSGVELPLGVTEVTFTAIDQAGNAARCAFTVTVEPAATGGADGGAGSGNGAGSGGSSGGCGGCSAPGGAPAWGLALLLPWLRRRYHV